MSGTQPTPAQRALIGRAVGLQQRGDYAAAEKIYAEVLAADPRQADAQQFMALLAFQTGREALSEIHMRRALELAPGRPDFHFNYGNMLFKSRRPQEAAQAFQRAVDINPDMTDAWWGLGEVLHSLNHDAHATVCFQHVLEQQPERVPAWHAIGECLQSLGLNREAIAAYQGGLQRAPNDPELHLALLTALIDARLDAEVDAAFARLFSLAPKMPEVYYTQGVWLANRGDFEAARAALKTALELNPDYYQAALYYSYVTPLKLDDPAVLRLLERAERDEWDDPGQGSNVHFALGYVLDKNKQYDEAFQHYLEANRLHRQRLDYSTAAQRTLQESMQQAFDAAFFARAARVASRSDKPLFIVGMPRSGTSMLEQMLSSHPLVHGGGEMTFLHAELRRRLGPRAQDDFAGGVLGLRDAELAEVAAGLVAYMDQMAPTARRVTDKMPSNFMLVGLLHALFPRAHIIHCIRDPLDTCTSCFTTSFKHGHKFTNDLKELGEYHRLYQENMAHWRKVLPPGTLYEIRYEDLVADTETQLRRLLEFCGLEWDPACLNFQENQRAVSTASVFQVRQPIYASAVGRWKNYATHLGPLMEALGLHGLV
ncbi:MAG TPA: sulfotransferase [Gammaproteobacteria bacterium]